MAAKATASDGGQCPASQSPYPTPSHGSLPTHTTATNGCLLDHGRRLPRHGLAPACRRRHGRRTTDMAIGCSIIARNLGRIAVVDLGCCRSAQGLCHRRLAAFPFRTPISGPLITITLGRSAPSFGSVFSIFPPLLFSPKGWVIIY